MASRHPIQDASELLRHIIKPLCAAMEAGIEGRIMDMRIYGEQVVSTLDACGYNREAIKLEKSIQ